MPERGLLTRIAREIRRDIASARERDPAARGVRAIEMLATWPGVQALLAHRVAHALYESRVPLLPRAIAYGARAVTGIEIHPAARIGDGLFIDHGTGVVIGETTEIGDRVRLYQGVTLGALSLPRDAGDLLRNKKRHPTIQDDVIIYSGATILGGKTIIGARSIIGGNVWLTESVPPDTRIILKKPELIYAGQIEEGTKTE